MNLFKLVIIVIFTQWIYPFNLSGIVYDSNKKRIDNVSIIISEDTSLNTTTNLEGEFFISNIDFGLCTIKTNHIAFKPNVKTID